VAIRRGRVVPRAGRTAQALTHATRRKSRPGRVFVHSRRSPDPFGGRLERRGGRDFRKASSNGAGEKVYPGRLSEGCVELGLTDTDLSLDGHLPFSLGSNDRCGQDRDESNDTCRGRGLPGSSLLNFRRSLMNTERGRSITLLPTTSSRARAVLSNALCPPFDDPVRRALPSRRTEVEVGSNTKTNTATRACNGHTCIRALDHTSSDRACLATSASRRLSCTRAPLAPATVTARGDGSR
jgi:hypothetical protein